MSSLWMLIFKPISTKQAQFKIFLSSTIVLTSAAKNNNNNNRSAQKQNVAIESLMLGRDACVVSLAKSLIPLVQL